MHSAQLYPRILSPQMVLHTKYRQNRLGELGGVCGFPSALGTWIFIACKKRFSREGSCKIALQKTKAPSAHNARHQGCKIPPRNQITGKETLNSSATPLGTPPSILFPEGDSSCHWDDCNSQKGVPQRTGNFQPCPLLGFDFRCTQIGTLDILDVCMVCSVLTSHLPTSLSSFRFASKPPRGLSSKRRRFHWTLLHVFVGPHVGWCFADPFSGIESRIVSLP